VSGRVALVTGAARGIGAATVFQLATEGWSVLAVDRAADDPALPYPLATAAELDAVVAEGNRLAASAGSEGSGSEGTGSAGNGSAARVAAFVADVRDLAALTAAVATAERRWGGLDAAIAGAGVIAGGVPLWEVPPEQEQAVLEIDLGGVISLARVAVPALLRRPEPRSGRFIAVASTAAARGLPMLAAYCAAKAGVTGLIRALAVELGGTGVTANAVSPGSTATDILAESARLYDLPSAQSFATQQPIQRLLDPAEIAAVIAFLAGPASSGMTGAIVPVDGGLGL
jgi:SDR family mycofactocin-dependent oxidoreductase